MPPLILSLLIATIYGCGCHVLFGRRLWQWPLFWAASIVGFFAGFAVGVGMHAEWLRIGTVPLLAATVGSVAMLWLCWFFTTPYIDSRDSPGSV